VGLPIKGIMLEYKRKYGPDWVLCTLA